MQIIASLSPRYTARTQNCQRDDLAGPIPHYSIPLIGVATRRPLRARGTQCRKRKWSLRSRPSLARCSSEQDASLRDVAWDLQNHPISSPQGSVRACVRAKYCDLSVCLSVRSHIGYVENHAQSNLYKILCTS